MWCRRWGATWCTAATARRTACARRVSGHASLRGRKLHAGSVCAALACSALDALQLCSMGCAEAALTATGPAASMPAPTRVCPLPWSAELWFGKDALVAWEPTLTPWIVEANE